MGLLILKWFALIWSILVTILFFICAINDKNKQTRLLALLIGLLQIIVLCVIAKYIGLF